RAVAAACPDASVWVIANVEPGSEEIEHDLREIPNVHFLGCLPHGTFQHYLYYADVALDSGTAENVWKKPEGTDLLAEAFVHSYRRTANNCKLWDYLAAGVPVVIDGAAGGDELIKQTGLGTIVPVGYEKAYVSAVRKYLEESSSIKMRLLRDKAIAWMRENHTWSATVARWVENFRKVVET
ncbi:MAG: hypothetical protein WCQ45_04465, partial [bacterium]